jgi:hypothetical protein
MIKIALRLLGVLLHAPRGPFYSPKAARSRWEQIWKAIFAFCLVAHRTVRCTPDTVRCPICFHRKRSRPLPTVADLAHRTVRCTPDSPVNFSRSRRRKTRERLVCSGVVWRTGHCPVHTGQSGAPVRSSLWLYTATLHFFSFLLSPVSNTWTRC